MTDYQLIENVLSGDTDSFRFLYRKYNNAAWGMALYICKNEMLAKDAMQVGFTSAFKYLNSFDNKASFKTWLLRIIHNEAVRIMKYEKRYNWGAEDGLYQLESEDNTAEHQLEITATRELIASVLEAMKETEALVLKMFYLQELKMAEIAGIINIKEGTVKVTLHRARHSFKTIMEQRNG